MRRSIQYRKGQSGTVLITVVLIAAFVVVLVIESVKTVRYQKMLSSNLINRDQAYSYLMGMEELAKVWMAKDFKERKENNVHLNQRWAQQEIAFPLEGGGMIATIKDMQSCFNLNSITAADQNQGSGQGGGNTVGNASTGAADPTVGQNILEEIISKVNNNTDLRPDALAAATRDWLDTDIDPAGTDGAEDDYYQSLEVPYRTANGAITHESELRAIRGFTRNIYTLLRPHICVLPDPEASKINVNTVTEEGAILLHAVINTKDITLSDVKQAISNRDEEGYGDIEEFKTELGTNADKISAENLERLDVTSEYFQIEAKAEIGKTRVTMKTLFKRDEDDQFSVVSRYFGKE